ncbi:hypothetical protein CYY_005613 [Polysphondylium violaceum]|uniref:t-SNARE coiled-coil homology domain-containing protein n=1 Tax=Polysphondylium violaceum TaxID=133409 RepID=A0A8J4PW41_9MYCE|nr:hypothetical protein CYY_005613 [Polysphondylium violaceum]
MDLSEYEADFESIANEIDAGVRDLNRNKKAFDVRQKAELLRNRLQRARQILKSYRIDFRELPKAEQTNYQAKATTYEERLKTLENDLNWAEKQSENGGLGAPQAQSSVQGDYEQTMAQAKAIQKKDIDAVTRIAAEVDIINQTGTATLEEMAVQDEQLKRIEKGMNEVDSNLKLATRQMRAFARKMATDKIIMGLVLLIVIAIIFVIVYSIVKPKSNPTVRNQIIQDK